MTEVNGLYSEFMGKCILDLSSERKKELAFILGISYFTMMNKAHGRGEFTAEQQRKYQEWVKDV